MELSDRGCTLADFRSVDADAAPSTRSSKRQGTQARREDVQRLDQPADLEQWGVPEWVHVVIVEGTDPTDPGRWGGDRSSAQWAVTCELARRRVPPGLIVGILTDKTWGISAHVLDQKRPGDYAWRQVEKAYQAAEVEGEPFQTDKDGKPYANQHNIRRSEEHTSELQSLMRISYAV